MQPPTVPPMMGARDCFFGGVCGGEEVVGEPTGEGDAVTVITVSLTDEEERDMP